MPNNQSYQSMVHAVAGPWRAILCDTTGKAYCSPDDVPDFQVTDLEISVIRGSHDGEVPGVDELYKHSDVTGDFDSPEDIRDRWAQATAVAAALNDQQHTAGPLSQALRHLANLLDPITQDVDVVVSLTPRDATTTGDTVRDIAHTLKGALTVSALDTDDGSGQWRYSTTTRPHDCLVVVATGIHHAGDHQ